MAQFKRLRLKTTRIRETVVPEEGIEPIPESPRLDLKSRRKIKGIIYRFAILQLRSVTEVRDAPPV
jgi:hypothetical protein